MREFDIIESIRARLDKLEGLLRRHEDARQAAKVPKVPKVKVPRPPRGAWSDTDYGPNIWRAKNGYTHAKLAETLGITRSNLNNYMQRRRPWPLQVKNNIRQLGYHGEF